MSEDLRGRLEILKEIENVEIRINRAKQSTILSDEKIIEYVKQQKQKAVELGKELRQVNLDKLKGLAAEELSLKSMGSIYNNLTVLDKKRILSQKTAFTLTVEQEAAISKTADINRELAQLSREDISQQVILLEELDMQKDILKSISAEHQYIVDNLNEQTNIAKIHSQLTNKQKDFLQKQKDVYDGIKDTLGGILDTARLLTSGPAGFFGGALIGAGIFAGKLGEVTKQLGGMRDIGTTALSFIDANAVENAKALSKEFGGMNNITVGLQASTSLIASNMGISGTEAVSLLGTFSRLNGNSTDVAKDLMVSTQEFAKQNGIIPSELMADLAANTEAFAKFGKDGGKNIIQAAAFAKKLGVEFSTLTGITEGLLDFESSITKELELGAMLGKNINLDRARALAFEGDIEGATKETLKALGGVEEFNKMDVFAKKASADLLGVSVAELDKMVNNQKEADTLSGKLNKNFSFLSESASYLANEFGGGFLSMLGGGVMAAAQMGGSFAQMGFDIKGMGKSAIDFVKNLVKGNALTQAQKSLSDNQIAAGFGGKKAKDMLAEKMGSSVQQSIKTTPIPDTANPAAKGGIMDSMSKIKMNDVLKGAAALVIVAGAVFIFGKAVQEFMKVSWEAVGMAVVSMLALVGAVALLGMIMSTPQGAIAILAGAAAMLVIAASVLVLGHALQAIGKGFEMLGNGITNLLPNLVGIGETISSLVMFIPAIAALSLSLMGLSASLVAFGVAGILAAPGLLALSAVGTIATGLGSILGIGGDGEAGGDDTMKILVDEIRGLREDLKSGKIGVYMDGTSVASKVSRVVDRIGVNSYS